MREMTTPRIVVGYDGSVPAGAAIEVAVNLLPAAEASITYVWTPPFASEALRHRLWRDSSDLDGFVEAIEREGEAEARRLTAMGVALAGARGWDATPVVERRYGGEGLQLDQVAARVGADLIVVGSRGLGGARAVLSSASDMAVHYAPCPVLVVPYPLLEADRVALDKGPLLVGWDGSAGARIAEAAATRLFPARDVLPAFVRDGDEPSGPSPSGLITLPGQGIPAEHGRAVAAALAGQARTRGAALIVVGSRGRSALREMMLGSVAMATLHQAHRPVLVVPHGYVVEDGTRDRAVHGPSPTGGESRSAPSQRSHMERGDGILPGGQAEGFQVCDQ